MVTSVVLCLQRGMVPELKYCVKCIYTHACQKTINDRRAWLQGPEWLDFLTKMGDPLHESQKWYRGSISTSCNPKFNITISYVLPSEPLEVSSLVREAEEANFRPVAWATLSRILIANHALNSRNYCLTVVLYNLQVTGNRNFN